ncbi:MAG: 30S ribosomal protein S6 [bacterium]
MNENNKTYQLSCLFSPLLNQEQLKEAVKNVQKEIIDKNGSVSEKENQLTNLIKKNLSYPIKKHQEAFCININFLLSPENINKLDKNLSSDKNIIRFMINIKKSIPAYEKKSRTMIKSKKNNKTLDFEIIDKIESLPEQKIPDIEQTPDKKPEPTTNKSSSKQKIEIEELDKKLEEILNG